MRKVSKDRCKRPERARAGAENLGEFKEHRESLEGAGGIEGI